MVPSIPDRWAERSRQASVACSARSWRWASNCGRGRKVRWRGLTGARVQRARSGQGVQSEVRKVACTMGSPWRLVPWRQLWAVLPLDR